VPRADRGIDAPRSSGDNGLPSAIHHDAIRHRTVFIDRDGVINRKRSGYVKSWEEIELIPGAIDAMAQMSSSGRDLIVLTNQSAIARRLVTREIVDAIHERLAKLVAEGGGSIKAFLVCPHSPEDRCECRKPAPGLFLRAQQELHVDLMDAVMIGDQASDVLAANAAGCDALLIDPSRTVHLSANLECTVVASIAEAAQVICQR